MLDKERDLLIIWLMQKGICFPFPSDRASGGGARRAGHARGAGRRDGAEGASGPKNGVALGEEARRRAAAGRGSRGATRATRAKAD